MFPKIPLLLKRRVNALILLQILGNLMFGRLDVYAQHSNWMSPAYADTLTAPPNLPVLTFAQGKKLFQAQCVVCHGESGKGEGECGFGLSVQPGDLTDDYTRQETDGAIFWKITYGKAPMPSFINLLGEEQRWQLVFFIRELQIQTLEKQNSKARK